jgi:carboxyl-terminal processing protease
MIGFAVLLTSLLGVSSPPPVDFSALGAEVTTRVAAEFLDAERARAWASRHKELGRGITEADAFTVAVRSALAELATSHTAYYRDTDAAYWEVLAIFEPTLGRDATTERIGAAFVTEADSWLVERTFPGGPAESAGLLRGDRILRAGGAPFDPGRSFRGKDGWPLALTVERRPGAAPMEVAVVPRRIDPAEEWIATQAATTRVVEVAGRRIGETRIFSCAGPKPLQLLADQMQSELAAAEALVLDLRGGWGGCDFRLVALFDPAVPQLESWDRDGTRSTFSSTWKKPLVVLIDQGSRSGKEAVARALQRAGRARLVGKRTAGAVVAGRPFLLSDGSLLYLAVRDLTLDGERLEGVGVAPDLEIAAPLLGAAGADPQRDAALALAARLVSQGGR